VALRARLAVDEHLHVHEQPLGRCT
jgi:hypothetical protein